MHEEISDIDISYEDFIGALREVATNADANGDNVVSIEEFISYLNAGEAPSRSRPASVITSIFEDADGHELAEDLHRACDCRPWKLFTLVLSLLIFIFGAIG